MNKKTIKIIFVILVTFLMITSCDFVFAVSVDSETIEQIQNDAENIDLNNITEDDLLKIYDDLTENYTTEEIAEIIEENKSELEKQGVSADIIDASTEILKTTDTETVRDIIKNDIDVNDIQEKIEQGYTADQIVKSIVEEIPTEQKVNIATKLFLANSIVRTILTVIVILFLYDIVLRWIIYGKAGEHSWAAIIPIYRDIVMYRISDISPWVILLWFLPILGWGILFIISIVQRICLATNFGRGALFAFGNVICPVIFESIIAFNHNIKYQDN